MTNDSIEIEYRGSSERPSRTMYYVNGVSVGQGDTGFDRVLDAVRQHKGARVTIRLDELPLGGEDPSSALPFKSRLKELQDLVSPKSIAYDLRSP